MVGAGPAAVLAAAMTDAAAAIRGDRAAPPTPPPTPAAPADVAPTAPPSRPLDRAAWQQRISQHDHRVMMSLLAHGLPLDRAREIAQAAWTRLMENDRAGKLADIQLPGLAIAQARFLATDERRRVARGDAALERLGVVADGDMDEADPERCALGRERGGVRVRDGAREEGPPAQSREQ
jgi:RNA polymerase sigma-70 factor (ECF subfamily)